MIKENPTPNLENGSDKIEKLGVEYNLKINDIKVHGFIKELKNARQVDAENQVVEFLKSALETAKSERLKILEILNNNKDKTYTFSTNMVVMANELNQTIKEIDKALEAKKLFEFQIPDKTISVYEENLEWAKNNEPEAFDVWVKQLRLAKGEREDLLTKMIKENTQEIIDFSDNLITKDTLTGILRRIHVILSKFDSDTVLSEETEGDKEIITEEKIPETENAPEETITQVTENTIEAEYESVTDRISDYLKTFEDKDNKISPEFRQYLNDFIKEKKVLAEKDNSEEAKNDLIALANLSFRLKSLNDKKGGKHIEHKPVQEEEKNNEDEANTPEETDLKQTGNENIDEDPSTYSSISEDIKQHSEILSGDTTDVEKEEVQVFVNININKVSRLLNTNKVKKLNKNSVLVKMLKSDLRQLKALNLKLNGSEESDTEDNNEPEKDPEPEPLSDYDNVIKSIIAKKGPQPAIDFLNNKTHKKITEALTKDINTKKESGTPEELVEFISKHQEKISELRELIIKHGADKGGALLNKLNEDFNILEELKKVDTEVKKPFVYSEIDIDKVFPEVRMNLLKSNPELYKKIADAYTEYNSSLISGDTQKTSDAFKNLGVVNQEFIDFEKANAPEPTENDLEKLGYKPIDTRDEKVSSFYVSPENEVLMKAAPDNLFTKAAEAMGEYNKELASKSSPKILDEKLKKVRDLQAEFIKYKNTLPKDNKNKKPGAEKKPDNGFEKIILSKKLSYNEDIPILLTNPELKKDLEDAIELYNEQVETNTSKKVVSRFYSTVEKLMSDFETYKTEFKEKLLNPKNKTATPPTPADVPVTPEPVSTQAEILSMDPNENYSEIWDDDGFDKWITMMSKSLKESGVDLSAEKKDAKNWYKEYKSVVPYIEKLNEMNEDIKENIEDGIELLATVNKIDDLIYKIHTEGTVAKERIDKIVEAYEKSKENKIKIEEYKKREELKAKIEKSKNKGGDNARKITAEQIKQVLESRGEENTAENLNELNNFLEDFKENYDFYSAGEKEDSSNNISHAYKKYTAVGADKKKIVGLTRWGKIWGSVLATLPQDRGDQDKFNHFVNMTREIRNLNLVNRNDGNENRALENQLKMSAVINFCSDKADLLDKYLTNKDSVDISSIESDPEQKKIFQAAVTLYKTFTTGKYRTQEAKAKAEKLLGESESFDSSITSTPTIELLYLDAPAALDKKMFEKNAKVFVNKKILREINSEIEAGTKSKNKTPIQELETLHKRLDAVKTVLEAIGSTEDKEALKTAEFKLTVLKVKNINLENVKELSDSFPIYEQILASKETTVAEKIEYINNLLENLKKLRASEENKNKVVQNAWLDAIIEKYQKVLTSIK